MRREYIQWKVLPGNKQDVMNGRHNTPTASQLPNTILSQGDKEITKVSPDFGCSLCSGLAVVKCPHTKFHVTPLEACSDPTFFMEKVSDTECKLKRDHPYYAQVQGQLGVTGAKWCDFMRILEREFTLREYHLMQPIGRTSGPKFFSITLNIF